MTLGANFQVKFQQYDDYPIYSDGIGYDDVRVYVEVPSEDWYSFTLEAGETASVSAAMILGPEDVVVELYDSGGNLLASHTRRIIDSCDKDRSSISALANQ